MNVFEEVLLLDCEDSGVLEIPVEGGTVLAYSARGPGKERNEDSLLVAHFRGGCLMAVADGMGGMNAGERASRLALETLAERLAPGREESEPRRHTLLDALEEANRRILDLGVGAGTTIAATILRRGRARTVHVGDSVCLQVGSRGRVKSWTISHSPIGYAVEAGLMDEEEAMHHHLRHLVSNHLGTEDMRIEFGPSVQVAKRDTLLVATDGLLDNLTAVEIVEEIRRGAPRAACQSLSQLARRRMIEPRPGEPSKSDDLSFLLYRPK